MYTLATSHRGNHCSGRSPLTRPSSIHPRHPTCAAMNVPSSARQSLERRSDQTARSASHHHNASDTNITTINVTMNDIPLPS